MESNEHDFPFVDDGGETLANYHKSQVTRMKAYGGGLTLFLNLMALGKSILLYYTIQILFVSVIAKIMLDTPFLFLLMYKKCTQKNFDLPCSEKNLIQIYGKYGYVRDFFFSAQLLIILLHIHTLLPNVHMYMH